VVNENLPLVSEGQTLPYLSPDTLTVCCDLKVVEMIG